jgi:hypothetical protein
LIGDVDSGPGRSTRPCNSPLFKEKAMTFNEQVDRNMGVGNA